jgi:3-oxoacyl-(acyl-carrier-protein) synthase
MSLTRAQWLEMWKSVQTIEDAYHDNAPAPHSGHRRAVRDAIVDLKEKIQSVVGQLEHDPRNLMRK